MFQEKEKLFNDLVIQWNRQINVVSRKKKNVYDLISDSLLFEKAIDFSKSLKIADIGTGAGFPGIVLAIRHPETFFTLIDSIKKKTNALEDIINKLGLSNTEIICKRAEELYKKKQYLKNFDYITARSVAPLDKLCKWSEKIIKDKGTLVTIKGSNISDELKRSSLLPYVSEIKSVNVGERLLISVIFS